MTLQLFKEQVTKWALEPDTGPGSYSEAATLVHDLKTVAIKKTTTCYVHIFAGSTGLKRTFAQSRADDVGVTP